MPRRGNVGRSIRLAALLLAVFFVLAAPAAAVFARAGGGEGYSGGGSSGGGGGHGDGVVWLIFDLIRLCVYAPRIGIPVLLIVLGVVWYLGSKGHGAHQASVIRRGNVARDRSRLPGIVSTVRGHDPAFDADAFLARVGPAFVKIQQAWSDQRLDAVRPFVSDAVHERFTLQFDEQRALGYRNQMSDVVVRSATLAHARSDERFDELAVRVEATAVDVRVGLHDGRPVGGSRAPDRFVEVWSFLRRRGAATRADAPGLMEGHCPNCAAAVELNQSANCKYCGALLRSGQYDWVLTEITQEHEWRPRPDAGDPPGAAAVRARDPGFNVQELEDRASVAFWRRAAADRLGSARPLRTAATPAYCDALDAAGRAGRGQPRAYFGECAVGSVDLLGVLPAGRGGPAVPADDRDRALVEVRWSGRLFTADAEGRPVRGEPTAVARLLLVLARSAAARSDPDRSVSSAHCPTCGAPEEGGSSGACAYCGTALTDGSRWVLEDAVAAQDDRGRALVAALPAAGGGPEGAVPAGGDGRGNGSDIALAPASALAWMVKMADADGVVEDRERRLLSAAARRYGVPAARLDEMIASAARGGLDLPPPADDDEARSQLAGMARVALADGKISGEEHALLRTTGRRLGLGDHDVKQLLNRSRAEAYADARAQLRAPKAAGRGGN